MVSAPTNKAISVLATRFLAATKKDSPIPCNAIMVGDADKLLVDERSNGGGEHADSQQQLKSIFLYSWIPTVMEGYTRIKAYFSKHYSGTDTVPVLYQLAVELQRRLTSSLPYLSADVLNWTGKIVTALESLQSGGAAHDIALNTEKLLRSLKDMPSDAVWPQVNMTMRLMSGVVFFVLTFESITRFLSCPASLVRQSHFLYACQRWWGCP